MDGGVIGGVATAVNLNLFSSGDVGVTELQAIGAIPVPYDDRVHTGDAV